MFSLQPVGVRRENPHPTSVGWEQHDGSVLAMAVSLLWQCPYFHAKVAFLRSGGSVLAQGSQGWDSPRQGRGLQGCRPFLPPLLSARRILHCNFKCYNFLITSSQTMSSLCSEGPPPSRLALHAPLTGSTAFMDKDSGIVWDRQLRGLPLP